MTAATRPTGPTDMPGGTSGRGRTPAARRDWAARATVLVSGTAVAAVAAVPDLDRYVLLLGGASVATCALAAVTPWRLTGTLAVLSATLTVLLAGALDASDLRPVQAVVDAALLLVLVRAVGAREEIGTRSPYAATVTSRSAWRRAGPPATALLAAVLIAVTASLEVVPSVLLVLAGLVAVVVALVVAAAAHRS